MGCCDDIKLKEVTKTDRRTVLKGMFGAIVGFSLGQQRFSLAQDNTQRIRLAFCSQLLCVVPYEFTRARGFFEEEGLEVELIYSRGGSAAHASPGRRRGGLRCDLV